MKRYSHYLGWLLTFFLCQFLGVVLFNLAINPYGAIAMPKIAGFNQVKPEQRNHVRRFKAIEITRQKPTIILLGSSRTEVGLNPNHVAIPTPSSTYNLGISGANMYEVFRYFQHALKNQPDLTHVILGIDFFMFNQQRENQIDFDETRLEKQQITLSDFLDVTFSLDALSTSYTTFLANRSDSSATPYYANGMRNPDFFIQHDLPEQSIVKGFKFSLNKYLHDPSLYQDYTLSRHQLNYLKQLIHLCQENQITIQIFISPSHATQWEAIRKAGLWSVFEDWKREVVKITPVWDFSGYNRITTEPISERMINYFDNSHYRQNVGDLVLNRLLQYSSDIVPKDFGVLITPETIESHLHNIRSHRETWVKTNPPGWQLLQRLDGYEK
ncbi:MAG: hypothetical protein RIM23_29445 [Coleofasciculus sp. G3-WIS-01]|uniref:hypothetical protein n=1 Tax=Coleofasciculus sp. G3-WIS-01 TaxID=3069528 RepID=UPI00330345FE